MPNAPLSNYPENFWLEFDDAHAPMWLRMASRIFILEKFALTKFKKRGYVFLRPYEVNHKMPAAYTKDGWLVRNYEQTLAQKLEEGSVVELLPDDRGITAKPSDILERMEEFDAFNQKIAELRFSKFSTERGRMKKVQKILNYKTGK